MPQPPNDVTDVMLWHLAADVTRNHQPDPRGRCAHPICNGAPSPCAPLLLARRADHAARRPTTATGRVTIAAIPTAAPTAGYPRRTPSWVALLGGRGTRPTASSDAATVLAFLQPGPATTETIAHRVGLTPDRVTHALQDLSRRGLAAPLTQAHDR